MWCDSLFVVFGELTTIMGDQSNFVTCLDYLTLTSVCLWCALALKYHIMKCSILMNVLLVQKLTHVLHNNTNHNRSKHVTNYEQIALLEIKHINMSHIDCHYLLIFFIWKWFRCLHKRLKQIKMHKLFNNHFVNKHSSTCGEILVTMISFHRIFARRFFKNAS